MRKVRKITAFLLALVLILSLAGCGNPQKRFIVYGRFQDNYTTDMFDVFCDWETINPLLEKCNFEEYGLYKNFLTKYYSSFYDCEEELNSIWLRNYSPNDKNINNSTPGSATISYGAQLCNSVESQNHVGDSYFKEPMIQIDLYNPKAKKDIEPDYFPGYRAVYSLDGELALEEGQWFLEEDKDEFCRHYFEIMLKIIGKGS